LGEIGGSVERKLLGALAGAWIVVMLVSSAAFADALTRSSCWVASFDNGSKRTLCFLSSGRTTMTNANQIAGGTQWSTCEFSGDYIRRGEDVTVTFPANSGRCTNGALSPSFTAVCTFAGDALPCKGSSIVDGKTYEFRGTFK